MADRQQAAGRQAPAHTVEIVYVEPWSGERATALGTVLDAGEAGRDSVYDVVTILEQYKGASCAHMVPVKWIESWRIVPQ